MSWSDHYFKFWHQQVYLRSGNLVFWFINLMSMTQGSSDPGWTSLSDSKMTTIFNSQPSSVFKMNFITHILLLWARWHICTLLSLLPMSENLGWILWIMDWKKYLTIGAVIIICYEYSNISYLPFIIGNTQKLFRVTKMISAIICLPYFAKKSNNQKK